MFIAGGPPVRFGMTVAWSGVEHAEVAEDAGAEVVAGDDGTAKRRSIEDAVERTMKDLAVEAGDEPDDHDTLTYAA